MKKKILSSVIFYFTILISNSQTITTITGTGEAGFAGDATVAAQLYFPTV